MIQRLIAPHVRLWQALLVILVSSWLMSLAAGYIAVRSNERSDQKWCTLMASLDDTYQEQPPTTPAGRTIAAEIHRLRMELGCPKEAP